MKTAGDIKITVLKEVVAEVEDSSRQISLEEAQWDDPDFEVGDVSKSRSTSRSSAATR